MAEIVKEKDVDGGWHEIALQQELNSCGPACVRILKEHAFTKKIGEDYLRGVVTLFEKNAAHTGLSPLATTKAQHDWSKAGAWPDVVLSAVKANPDGILHARIEAAKTAKANVKLFKPHLDAATANHPALIAVDWEGGGSHYIVVIKPSKDKKGYIIQDPWYGVQFLTWPAAGVIPVYEGGYNGKDPKKKGQKFKGTINSILGVIVTTEA